jgi:hypothetical protein
VGVNLGDNKQNVGQEFIAKMHYDLTAHNRLVGGLALPGPPIFPTGTGLAACRRKLSVRQPGR